MTVIIGTFLPLWMKNFSVSLGAYPSNLNVA
jgi:hypothetical protein